MVMPVVVALIKHTDDINDSANHPLGVSHRAGSSSWPTPNRELVAHCSQCKQQLTNITSHWRSWDLCVMASMQMEHLMSDPSLSRMHLDGKCPGEKAGLFWGWLSFFGFIYRFRFSFIAGTWQYPPSTQAAWVSQAHSTTKQSTSNGPMPRILLQERGSLGCTVVWVCTCSGMHPSKVYQRIRPPVGGIDVLVCNRAPGLIV